MTHATRKMSGLLALLFALTVLGAMAAAGATMKHMGVSNSAKGMGPKPVMSRGMVMAAPKKSGGKARGAGDIFHVNNHTGYSIDIYVNGGYVGTVGPYGDLYCPDDTGGEYTARGVSGGLHWGTISFSTPFEWNLYN